MNRDVEVDVNITRRDENRILLQFDRFEFTDHPSYPSLDVTGHRLEIDRNARRAAHHDRPQRLLWYSEIEVYGIVAARGIIPAAWAMLIPWFARGAVLVVTTRAPSRHLRW